MSDATVMDRLRAETRDLHDRAEGHAFQRRMVAGELQRADYVRWLTQMLIIHDALETPLRDRAASDPRFAAVRDEQYQVPYLREDLATLTAAAAQAPLPAARAIAEDILGAASRTPLRLLGYHYVLEGSNNGNRFIARALGPRLGLDDGAGLRYLDPYGAAQPEKWRQFKRDMNAIGFQPAEVDELVAAARRMFEAVGDLSNDLMTTDAQV